jgi:formiminotetrahydrofolate cyclodeaminase
VSDGDGGFGAATLDAFTSYLASAEPVPGGGSAAAVAASLGAALTVMVARLSQGRPRYMSYTATLERAVEAGESARRRFLQLADIDAQAYAGYAAAMKLPRESEVQRTVRAAALAEAAKASTLAPLETVRLCHTAVSVVEMLAGRCNVNASSDLNVAALLLDAASEGAAANVRVNLPFVTDAAFAAQAADEVTLAVARTHALATEVQRIVSAGTVRDPEGR